MSKSIGNNLFSPPYYNNHNGISWCLLRISFKKPPDWASENQYSKWVFREIAYLNKDGEFKGLGRSWIKPSFRGLKILVKCLSLLDPKPLGKVLESYCDNLKINVVYQNEIKDILSPYMNIEKKIEKFRREIIDCENFVIFTEEEFILDEN